MEQKINSMKPLIYYCRWQRANLRLRGRNDTAVWGQLVYGDGDDNQVAQPFHFNLQNWQLALESLGGKIILQLDEMGIEVESNGEEVDE